MAQQFRFAVTVLLVVVLSLCVASAQFTSKPGISLTYRGRATFNKFEFGEHGHCSLGPSNSLDLPWKQGVVSVAVNSKQYSTTPLCGLCVEIRGLAANGPLANGITYGMVVDECTKCRYGDIVVKGDHGGYHPVEWQAVQCKVGGSKFQYSFQGSNPYFIKIAITNTRLPIASVHMTNGNEKREFQRTDDNFWAYGAASGQVIQYPLTLEIKSFTDDVVTETLTITKPEGIYHGKGQFPYKESYAAVS